MIRWVAFGRGDPAEYRVPVLVAAVFVLIPSVMVPVMGFGAIATSANGGAWVTMAGTLAGLGSLGIVLIVAGAAAAATLSTPPIPAMLVAAGTTLALIAGILMVPVLMAGLAG